MPGDQAKREDVQKIILALLVSQKDAISLWQLDKDYKEQEGECIPWKEFGYISLFDYLKSIPKYFHLEKINGMYYVRGIASDKSKHVSMLVARQKDVPKKSSYLKTRKPSPYYPHTERPRVRIPANILSDIIYIVREHPNGIHKEYILRTVRERLPYIHVSSADLEEQFRNLSHELFMQGNLVFPTKSNTTYTPSEMATKVEENFYSENTNSTLKYCVSGDSDSEYCIDDGNDFSFVPNDSKENNKSALSKKKQPISMFIQETLLKCNVPDDKINDTSGYNITENGQGNRESNGINDIVIPCREDCKEDNNHISAASALMLIPERTRFRLQKLIQKYPNGIWCAELPEKYLQEYNISLDYDGIGFNSVREYASFLPEIFECKQLQPSGDYILYDAKLSSQNSQNSQNNKEFRTELSQFYQEEEEKEPLPSVVSSDISNKLMPEGVMVIGETVGQISVVDLENRLQPYVEVFVEEVFTPSLFWVQLRKKKKLFNKLMEDLHTFYEEKYALYKIPHVVLEKGLNCACIYNKQWHRGIIKTVKPDLQVTVMFYDYGTLKTYPPDAVYYLHRSFSYLPAQAIPCGLYNTKPCNGEQWSRGVTHEFAFKTTQRPLIATIVSTDPKNNSMLVTLTDTMEEEDVHINDWMVQNHFALHGKMVRIRPRNFPFHYYLQCKKVHETNSIDCISSESGIKKIYKRSILSQCLTANSTQHDLSASSNHVLSASVSSSFHNVSSNDSKKDIQISLQSDNNSIPNNNLKKKRGLALFLEKIVNSKKLSSSSYEAKADNTQLHSDTNMIYSDKNESKTELEKTDNSNCASSSITSNNPIRTESQNNCLSKSQLQNQHTYSTNTNCKNYVENQEVNICIQQKEPKQKETPLPKKCFINAVNLSIDSKPYYPDHNTLPDDNITINNDISKLITNRKRKINLKNIEIGISEITLSALKSNRNHVNNECSSDEVGNVTSSLNQFQNIVTDFQQNTSSDNKTVVLDVQKHFNINNINENKDYKFNDGSPKSYNMLKEECIFFNKIEDHKLITNDTIDSNSNSISIYDDYFANVKNKMHRLDTFNTLLKIYNTCNDDSKLDSDDSLSNLENYNINIHEIETKICSSISNISIDDGNEEKSNIDDNSDTNKSNLITDTCNSQIPLESENSEAKEKMKYDETIDVDPDKDVILSHNYYDMDCDNNEWDIVGDLDDFFPNHFLSNVRRNDIVNSDDEKRVQITEITDE